MSTSENPVNRFFDNLDKAIADLTVADDKARITVEALTQRVAQLEYAYSKLLDSVGTAAPVEFQMFRSTGTWTKPPVGDAPSDMELAVSWAATYKRNLEVLQKACTEFMGELPWWHTDQAFKKLLEAVESSKPPLTSTYIPWLLHTEGELETTGQVECSCPHPVDYTNVVTCTECGGRVPDSQR